MHRGHTRVMHCECDHLLCLVLRPWIHPRLDGMEVAPPMCPATSHCTAWGGGGASSGLPQIVRHVRMTHSVPWGATWSGGGLPGAAGKIEVDLISGSPSFPPCTSEGCRIGRVRGEGGWGGSPSNTHKHSWEKWWIYGKMRHWHQECRTWEGGLCVVSITGCWQEFTLIGN